MNDFDYADGQWYAVPMGVLLQILVDSGHDPAVLFRITRESNHGDRTFTREMEIISIPDGHVAEVIDNVVGLDKVPMHKVLRQFLKKGLIK